MAQGGAREGRSRGGVSRFTGRTSGTALATVARMPHSFVVLPGRVAPCVFAVALSLCFACNGRNDAGAQRVGVAAGDDSSDVSSGERATPGSGADAGVSNALGRPPSSLPGTPGEPGGQGGASGGGTAVQAGTGPTTNLGVAGGYADGGSDWEPAQCPSAESQSIPVPDEILETGGTLEVRLYAHDDFANTAVVVRTHRATVDPETETVSVEVGESDYQFAVFRDPGGRPVDGQVHQSTCERTRPVRGGLELRVPQDFATIQGAIDAAAPGDTVRVGPGVYTEHIRLEPNVALVGAGPDETILDGQGSADEDEFLVDMSGAYGSSLRGFRLRGVAQGGSCARPDVFLCGRRHNAALVADGHGDDCCQPSTFFVTGNVFEGNDIGAFVYHRNLAIFVDNAFVDNDDALVLNHGGNQIVEVEQNLFRGSSATDIATDASFVFARSNAFLEGMRCRVDHIQRGEFSCNAFSTTPTCDLAETGSHGNGETTDDPPFAASIAAECVDATSQAVTTFADFLVADGVATSEND